MVAVTIENISNKLDTITRHQPASLPARKTAKANRWGENLGKRENECFSERKRENWGNFIKIWMHVESYTWRVYRIQHTHARAHNRIQALRYKIHHEEVKHTTYKTQQHNNSSSRWTNNKNDNTAHSNGALKACVRVIPIESIREIKRNSYTSIHKHATSKRSKRRRRIALGLFIIQSRGPKNTASERTSKNTSIGEPSIHLHQRCRPFKMNTTKFSGLLNFAR